jgi:hypothetical protein
MHIQDNVSCLARDSIRWLHCQILPMLHFETSMTISGDTMVKEHVAPANFQDRRSSLRNSLQGEAGDGFLFCFEVGIQPLSRRSPRPETSAIVYLAAPTHLIVHSVVTT